MCSSVISSHSQVSTSGRRNSQLAYLPTHMSQTIFSQLTLAICETQNSREICYAKISIVLIARKFQAQVIETHVKSGSGKSCSMRACALAFQDLGWRVWFGTGVSRHRWRHGQARARPAPPGHPDPLPHAQGGYLHLCAVLEYPQKDLPNSIVFRRSASAMGIVT